MEDRHIEATVYRLSNEFDELLGILENAGKIKYNSRDYKFLQKAKKKLEELAGFTKENNRW
jgi:hypothetical protein